MQEDLISRSALLEVLNYNKDESENLKQRIAVDIDEMIDYVKNMPPASIAKEKSICEIAIDDIQRGRGESNYMASTNDLAIAALEKQIPWKVIVCEHTNKVYCQKCGAIVRGASKWFGDWCSNCGQKLDWSDLK